MRKKSLGKLSFQENLSLGCQERSCEERERILNLYTAASKQKVLRRGATGRRKVTYLGKQSII